MTEEELVEKQKEYQEMAHYYRGKIIDTFCSLEKSLESYLIKYFNPHNYNEFQNIVLDRLTFEAKRTAFRAILEKKEDLGGFVKTKNNSYPHGKFLDEIRLLNDQRNYFAHYVLITPELPSDSIITLAEFRDSLKFISYSEEKFRDIVYRILKAHVDIVEMTKKLPLLPLNSALS